MPTRVFTQLHATSGGITMPATSRLQVSDGGVVTNTNANLVILETDPGTCGYTISETLASFATGCALTLIDTAQPSEQIEATQLFSIDYTLGAGIPDNVLISKVTWRKPVSANFSAGFTDPTTTTYIALFNLFTGSDADVASFLLIESLSGIAADTIVFEATTPGDRISKADLIADFSDFEQILTTKFKAICLNASGSGSAAATCTFGSGWTVTVEYENIYDWALHQPDEPLDAGTTVIATSPTSAVAPIIAVDFTEVTAINMNYEDENGDIITVPVTDFDPITENLIEIVIPPFVGDDEPTVVEIELISTQFDGTEAQQLYTTNFVSASGIYQFDLTKTSDTLYVEGNLEIMTNIEVKIPDPHGKTGFFGK